MPILWFVVWIATWQALTSLPAQGQHTHEGEVGQFYQTWRMPENRDESGNRIQGCCSGIDCRPALEMRKNTRGTSQWEALVNVPYSREPLWIAIPDSVWEDVQPDPRESPDERNHVCVQYNGRVVCAVRTGGF